MFTLYSANCLGRSDNCLYPNKVEVVDADSLVQAVSHDYVCAEYKGNYRSNDNYIGSDCLSVECDNDHSENPADWKTPQDIADAFPDVMFAVHYSRNHMKEKNGRSARPKFHAFFAISPITDPQEYSALKKHLYSIFPYFDTKALDAARFYFGTATPNVDIFDGTLTLTDFLIEDEFDRDLPSPSRVSSTITEGSRNATMSRFAGCVLKKYGDNEMALQCFMEEAEKCNPPLEHKELMTIWHSAQKFYAKVQQQDGYIAPEQYNQGYSLRPSDYSDIGQAKVLASTYKGELVYTDSTDYMRFDGTHWSESRQLAVGAAEDFLDSQLEEANLAVEKAKQALLDSGVEKDILSAGGKALEKAIDDRSEKAFAEYCFALSYKAFVMKRRDMKYITSALQAAKPMLLRNIRDFDTQEYFLNTPVATYDLRLGMSGAHEHSPEDLITKITSGECSCAPLIPSRKS